VSLHKFPTSDGDEVVNHWVTFVRGPFPNFTHQPIHKLCSDHFSSDCFIHQRTVTKSSSTKCYVD
jgi:hypothetical protein